MVPMNIDNLGKFSIMADFRTNKCARHTCTTMLCCIGFNFQAFYGHTYLLNEERVDIFI